MDSDVTVVSLEIQSDHVEHGGLTGSVGAQKAENLPVLDVERVATDSLKPTLVDFGQRSCLDWELVVVPHLNSLLLLLDHILILWELVSLNSP